MRWIAAAAVLACLAVGLTPGTAGAVTKSCGSEQLQKPSGGYWTCAFGDDFNGTALDPDNWDVMQTATMFFTQVGECYVNDPSHVSVDNGKLTLTATRSPQPTSCGWFSTPYQSGMVFTKYHFAQAYGRFEIRAKLPVGTGFWPAFWMWPEDMAYGKSSGEIDVAEAWGSFPDSVSPHIHMKDANGVDHPQGAYCRVPNSASAFHTYTVEWTPTEMRFIYDGTPCWTLSSWTPPSPLVAPQPFDRPFYMILQLALGYGWNAPTASTPFPGKFVIDYARAWS